MEYANQTLQNAAEQYNESIAMNTFSIVAPPSNERDNDSLSTVSTTGSEVRMSSDPLADQVDKVNSERTPTAVASTSQQDTSAPVETWNVGRYGTLFSDYSAKNPSGYLGMRDTDMFSDTSSLLSADFAAADIAVS